MPDAIDEFLANYPPNIQAISQRLRVIVKESRPQGIEVLYAKENHTGYSFTGKYNDQILYICPLNKYVRLGFMRGAFLSDPEKLLVGEGKWLRHIKIHTLNEADRPTVAQLVKAAWENGLSDRK